MTLESYEHTHKTEAYSVDLDHMQQNALSDQGLLCLALIHQNLDTSAY